jgi:trk system potassium uptake protein TrkH
MNLRTVAWHSSSLLLLVAAMMLAPAMLALSEGGHASMRAYLGAALLTAGTAALMRKLGRERPQVLHRKDALGVVALTWLLLGLFGALPFMLEGSIPSFASAVFEAVSGFTTTGSTVVADVDGLSRATNLWRCEMHWVGGMGIVVLFVAVFPQLGVGAKHLFKAEVAGPITEGLRPRIKQTALVLWWVYAGMTLAATLCLFLAGMPLYDAVCHAFSTLGTGGFSTRTASIGAYDSAAIDWITIVFMWLAGLNFALYYGLLRGNVRAFFTDYEMRFFLLVNVTVTAVIFVGILPRHGDALLSLRHAAFQTLAVTSTTGFMTEDFDSYPELARILLFGCMFMGGCAGSTAGGIKASRVYALLRMTARELRLMLQPQEVVAVRLGRTAISPAIERSILAYVVAYLMLVGVTSVALVAMGLDLVSATSATVACLSSVGPGLGQAGPTNNFEFIPAAGKLLLSACMIAGRLEIFALFAVFSPECWRR